MSKDFKGEIIEWLHTEGEAGNLKMVYRRTEDEIVELMQKQIAEAKEETLREAENHLARVRKVIGADEIKGFEKAMDAVATLTAQLKGEKEN